MIKIESAKNGLKSIFINPQQIEEVRVDTYEEADPNGGANNVYLVYKIFFKNTMSEISSKEFKTYPLQDWLNISTLQFKQSGKMLY